MIQMQALGREPAEIRARILERIAGVLGSGTHILGPEVADFEAAWAAAVGTGHAVGTGNGLDALEIALRCAGIGEGDEVITTPMTAVATVLAIVRAGATPVLADIDPHTALLDPVSAERCVSPRTKAVLLVHLYGRLADMEAWEAFVRRHDLILIEDAAQAHLAERGGRRAGSFGRAAAFSFYPTKNLGAVGDAGAVVTDDAEIAERARRLRNYGQSDRYRHPELGLNSRLDELQAAILTERLAVLPRATERRRAVATQLRDGLGGAPVSMLRAEDEPGADVHHLFVVRSDRRDALAEHLRDRGVASLIHYPIPVHLQPPFVDVRRDPEGLAASEAHARECLTLPCHPHLDDVEVATIVDAVRSFT